MSLQTYGLLGLTFFSLVGLAVIGCICLAKGKEIGFHQGLTEGHAQGWRDAHTRVSSALDIPPVNLNLLLLERELVKIVPEEGTPAGRLMVEKFRATARDDQPAEWGEEAFS